MERQQHSNPTIIDEDGKPFIDPGSGEQRTSGSPFGAGNPFVGMPGAGGPGIGVPLMAPIPERLLNRKGKLSFAKLLGWKGIAILVLVVAGLIALAAVSVMFLVFALPILLLIGVIGWVASSVRGGNRPAAAARGRQVIVVRR